jgi:hypothetical protein
LLLTPKIMPKISTAGAADQGISSSVLTQTDSPLMPWPSTAAANPNRGSIRRRVGQKVVDVASRSSSYM